jgi:hypothetical protein
VPARPLTTLLSSAAAFAAEFDLKTENLVSPALRNLHARALWKPRMLP